MSYSKFAIKYLKNINNFNIGETYTADVKKIMDYGLFLSLEEGLELEVVIANINNKDREIILSLRALEKQEEKSALKDNAEKNREIEQATKSNIGDLIKAVMEETSDEDEQV